MIGREEKIFQETEENKKKIKEEERLYYEHYKKRQAQQREFLRNRKRILDEDKREKMCPLDDGDDDDDYLDGEDEDYLMMEMQMGERYFEYQREKDPRRYKKMGFHRAQEMMRFFDFNEPDEFFGRRYREPTEPERLRK